ncbi:MAG TPA: HAMP domain-containing sensor histidine kinase [Vicinamibacterales bacterium]|nr:HAMP domain-containing sensor histidine kinase [Vicinamibacterales bacterium]
MGISAWLRLPRRLLALFAVVTLVPALVLLWLGWKVIEQDRDLDGPRAQARLDRTATLVADGLLREIHAAIDALPAWAASPPASIGQDAALVNVDAAGTLTVRGAALPFVPIVAESSDLGPEVWEAGESAEIRGDLHAAAGEFTSRVSSSDPGIRAGALVRLAGVLRNLRQFEKALAAYRALSAIDARVDGEPAELVGRAAACEMLSALDRGDQLAQEAASLAADLRKGRWAIDRGSFEFRSSQVRGWTSMLESGVELSLASAIDAVWPAVAGGAAPESGARTLWQDDLGLVVIWRRAAGGVTVLAASAEWVAREWRSVWSAEPVEVALTDDTGRAIVGRQPGPDQPSVARARAETGLPWTVRASVVVSDAELAAARSRRWLIGAGVGVLLLLIPACGYVIARAMQKELAVARLQADFVSAVSHEFRTPLTAMSHLVDRLQRDPAIPDARRREYYDALSRDTHRLRRFVESLLDFGRMEAGAATVRLEPTDLSPVVAAVVEEFRADPAAGRHPVALATGAAAPIVRIDRESFGRALWNLLDNAAKYSPPDAPIDVETTIRDAQAIVRVRDRGIGVPVSERQSIFRKFVRGTGQISSGIRGTGVGLAMVDQIVRAHGGEIRLESEVGAGSEFSIVLPVAAERSAVPVPGMAGMS